MPGLNQKIGDSIPKTGAFQYSSKRIQGVPLTIPAGVGVTETSPRHFVSLQEDAAGNIHAVLGHKPYVADVYETWKVIGYGILEEALQSNTNASIAPAPNTYNNGTLVTVIRDIHAINAVAVDPDNVPDVGIATATIDNRGRLSSVAADADHKQTAGAVFTGKMALEMDNLLAADHVYFQLNSPVAP